MKRVLAISVAIVVLFSVAVFAQGGRGSMAGGGRNGGATPGEGQGRGPGALFDYLGLSEAQQTQWEALHEQFRTSMEPIFVQQQALREQIQALLDAGTSDPAAIGMLVIQQHALQQQVRTAHETLQTNLKAILTAEQLIKYEAFLAARGNGPHSGRGPGGPGGGPPPCTTEP